MMVQTARVLRVLAASLAATLLAANAARADVTWILQPSNSISLTAQIGSIDANNVQVELYNGVQQTDPGTGLFTNANPYYNFTNGLSSRGIGTFTTYSQVGDPNGYNNFLNSVNFGAQPATTPTAATATTVTLTSGNWLPGVDGSGDSIPGVYGTPGPQNMALALIPVGGVGINNGGTNTTYPDNGADGGRLSLYGSYGTLHSNGMTVAVGSSGAMPAGEFSAQNMGITGALNLGINFNSSTTAIATPLGESGNVNQPANSGAIGAITRGTGATSYQYIMTIPFPAASLSGNTGMPGATYNIAVNYHLVGAANLVPGDANFDGIVNGQDIAAVASNWLTMTASKLGNGDVTGDGIVNGQDIALIASNWLQMTPAVPSQFTAPLMDPNNPGGYPGGGGGSAVPEPGTWLLLGLGGVGVLVARRRTRR